MAKPIFCLTHPRACSTAFERVFMTRTNDLTCVHEPFGDAFYFGPERLGSRYEDDEASRLESGFTDSTFKTVLERIEREGNEGKRLFIKDISHYLFPPLGAEAQIAPSLLSKRRGIGTDNESAKTNGSLKPSTPPFPYGTEAEPGNPTIMPLEILKKFHFTFLIRNPHNSIPSYYRCTIPPLSDLTGFHNFDPAEAGYDEQRRILDYLVASGQVGPERAGQKGSVNGINGHATNGTNGHAANGVNGHTNGINGHNENEGRTHEADGRANGINGHAVNGNKSNGNPTADICVIDADDLLDNPEGIVKEYCRSVGLSYDPSMLVWDTEESHLRAKDAFEKWRGFHEDAIESRDLKPRAAHKKKQKTEEEWDAEWNKKFGGEGAKIIRETVDANMADYLYLKQFAMRL